MLKQYHQLRSSTFVYPDERSMPGSTQTFIAFHNRMLARDVMAVCSFVRAKGGEPRLVALLAQEEVQDEYQTQVSSLADCQPCCSRDIVATLRLYVVGKVYLWKAVAQQFCQYWMLCYTEHAVPRELPIMVEICMLVISESM